METVQWILVWAGRQIWRALPLLIALFCLVLMSAPMNLLQDFVPPPDIALIAVFFWAIHGPEFLPPGSVFAIGLSQDLLTGAPLGFWAFVLLVAYGFTLSQRVFFRGRTGIGVWLGFAIVAVAASVLAWVMGLAVSGKWLAPDQAAAQLFVSIGAYPIVARLLLMVRGMLTTAPQSI